MKCKKFIRNPVSSEKISGSVELWDIDVKFLHIQSNFEERIFDFQINIKIPVKLISSLPDHL